MIETIKEIKNIEHYNSAYNVIDENVGKDFFDKNNFNDDDICFLKHFDDYEYCTYYVINYAYVMIAQCGDIEGDIMTMEEFANETMRMLNEDREEREQAEMYNWEVIEMCPHCGNENYWEDLDPTKCNYTAVCQHCGKTIMLCDACFHSDDNPYRKCDWHKCEGCEKGECFRSKKKVC